MLINCIMAQKMKYVGYLKCHSDLERTVMKGIIPEWIDKDQPTWWTQEIKDILGMECKRWGNWIKISHSKGLWWNQHSDKVLSYDDDDDDLCIFVYGCLVLDNHLLCHGILDGAMDFTHHCFMGSLTVLRSSRDPQWCCGVHGILSGALYFTHHCVMVILDGAMEFTHHCIIWFSLVLRRWFVQICKILSF